MPDKKIQFIFVDSMNWTRQRDYNKNAQFFVRPLLPQDKSFEGKSIVTHWYLWEIGSRTPCRYQICRCSSPLYKIRVVFDYNLPTSYCIL